MDKKSSNRFDSFAADFSIYSLFLRVARKFRGGIFAYDHSNDAELRCPITGVHRKAAFFKMIVLINEAKISIHFSSVIYRNEEEITLENKRVDSN